MIPTLVTGDDSIYEIQLTKNEENFRINNGATVKASLISKDRKTVIIPPVILSDNDTNSDWLNSLVVVKFDSADTDAIPTTIVNQKNALLEIQVDDGGKLTWFHKIQLVKGTIDQ